MKKKIATYVTLKKIFTENVSTSSLQALREVVELQIVRNLQCMIKKVIKSEKNYYLGGSLFFQRRGDFPLINKKYNKNYSGDKIVLVASSLKEIKSLMITKVIVPEK